MTWRAGSPSYTESIDTVYTARPLRSVEPLVLVPRGGTPLLDAVGTAIAQTGERLKALPEAKRPKRVQVLILTDGQENSSREYTKTQVKAMVEHQQSVYQWAFVYLGANVDAFAEAAGMGILVGSAAPFSATATGVREAFVAASNLVGRYHAGGAALTRWLGPRSRSPAPGCSHYILCPVMPSPLAAARSRAS